MDAMLNRFWAHQGETWFTALLIGLEILWVLAPAIGGFFGGFRWGWRGGIPGLLIGYFASLCILAAFLFSISRCTPKVCPGYAQQHMPLLRAIIEFVVSALNAIGASLPWHVLWLAPSVACLYGGVVLRRRRLGRKTT